ncbi:uncharacterized protein BDR25DRAFT_352106 [Lindgomyces ingoldianus]|uniref:Uncharacterized protein n=1 Tax=Lindgomyces ingoldianus TaxID=673940 RepID=A0ACB6R5P9_9PLEO|nr:uncharacterized protein BDR25DRAFT_352106 [Lindgomyces ingoldianus]KAF2473617.1 hypothetical protein BDR25DRAFT_352106 [Lindgomyces ingoldianus]
MGVWRTHVASRTWGKALLLGSPRVENSWLFSSFVSTGGLPKTLATCLSLETSPTNTMMPHWRRNISQLSHYPRRRYYLACTSLYIMAAPRGSASRHHSSAAPPPRLMLSNAIIRVKMLIRASSFAVEIGGRGELAARVQAQRLCPVEVEFDFLGEETGDEQRLEGDNGELWVRCSFEALLGDGLGFIVDVVNEQCVVQWVIWVTTNRLYISFWSMLWSRQKHCDNMRRPAFCLRD